jgi:hypothetical protein
MSIRLVKAVSLIFALFFPRPMFAQVIDVAFQGRLASISGSAVMGAAGDAWNTPLANNVWGTPLVLQGLHLTDVKGASTGVTLTVSNFFGGNAAPAGLSQTPNPALTTQYVFQYGSNGTGDIILSGLAPGHYYNLDVYSSTDPSSYGQPPDHGPRPVSISVNGSGPTYVSADPTATQFIAGTNYAPFPGVLADPTGAITIVAAESTVGRTGNSSNEFDVNGLQLQAAVPEPSTLLLTAAVAAVYLCRRRHGPRRRHAAETGR